MSGSTVALAMLGSSAIDSIAEVVAVEPPAATEPADLADGLAPRVAIPGVLVRLADLAALPPPIAGPRHGCLPHTPLNAKRSASQACQPVRPEAIGEKGGQPLEPSRRDVVSSLVMLTLLDSHERDAMPRPTQPALPRVVRRSELAALLGISSSTLMRMLAAGLLPVAPLPWPGHPRWARPAVSLWVGGVDDLPDDAFRLLTIPEVAGHLGISRSSAYRALPIWTAAGIAVKCVSDWRIPQARLGSLLASA